MWAPLWARHVGLYIKVKDGPWARGFSDKIIKFLNFNYLI